MKYAISSLGLLRDDVQLQGTRSNQDFPSPKLLEARMGRSESASQPVLEKGSCVLSSTYLFRTVTAALSTRLPESGSSVSARGIE